MTEQKLEERIKAAADAALKGAGLDDYQIFCSWSPEDGAKAVERPCAQTLAVTVQPRSYETPMVPYADFQAQCALVTRADEDEGGKDALKAADALMRAWHGWQLDFQAAKAAFQLDGEMDFQGFRLDGGECGLDADRRIWTYVQNFTIQGTIKKEHT